MPAVIFHSVRLGAYSTTSCSVDGMKPGMISPIPFSIQMPTMHSDAGDDRASTLRSQHAGVKNSDRADDVQRDRRPDPRHQAVLAVVAEEQVASPTRRARRRCRRAVNSSENSMSRLTTDATRMIWTSSRGRAGAASASRSRTRMTCSTSRMNAGPDTNADARNRGASRAVFQNGRPPSPQYRNAVTVWMLIAQKIERNTNGTYHFGFGSRPRNRMYSR